MSNHEQPDPAALLDHNTRWADEFEREHPGFLRASAENSQTPRVLWIGCSDSRVPASVVTQALPGDIFVHRNIANQVHLDDDSVLSVIEFAVGALNVSHIVVVGHTLCGGAIASYRNSFDPAPLPEPTSALGRWLVPLTKLAQTFPQIQEEGPDQDAVILRLIEVNVKEQVKNVSQLDVVKTNDVQVHAWVHQLEDGKLRKLD